jgi:cysteine desulfurase
MASGIPHEIYLDNNATTQPLPQVREAMAMVLGERFGNPSSAHAAGDRAREHIRCARKAVAKLIGVDSSMVFFTSSGTEANNMVLASVLRCRRTRPRIVTTEVEHSSILTYCEYVCDLGVEVIYLPVDRTGRLSLAAVETAITPETSLVSVQWVNNETGVIQPIVQIGALCRVRGVPFHTDAAQAVGKLTIEVSTLPIDFLSLTAHKFHGPQGIGALYARHPRWLSPMLYGGSQEGGLRAGTENVPGIVGMGKAAELRLARFGTVQHHLQALRDRFENLVLDMVPGTEVNGDRIQRVCNTTNLLFRGFDGEALVAQLDHVGIRCSQSSACTNMHPEPSYVLRAMGLSEDDAYASVRFGVSEQNTLEEIEWAAQQIREICYKLRAFGAGIRSEGHHRAESH